jgi:holo-[acyl-carrier protein] synthase
VFFSNLSVVNLPSGQPTLRMTGGSAERLQAITPPGMVAQVALTMTDEYPYAYAQVIISAIPAPAD